MKTLFFAGSGFVAILFACSSSTDPTGVGTLDAGPDTSVAADAGGGTMCSAARDTLLVPINKTSAGEVTVLSDTGGVKTIYVDASAGGINKAAANPRVYIDLGAGTRVDLTDATATTSADWDLALKRPVIYTNGGDSGPGAGGAVEIDQAFDAITDAQVMSAVTASESFFDADCNPKYDQTGSTVLTTFSNWYDYDMTTMIPSPDPGRTFVVKGGTGRLYKVGIKAYDALADGGSRNNMSTGYFLLQVHEVTP